MLGRFVPAAVATWIAGLNKSNEIVVVEGDRRDFESYFVAADGSVQRIGDFADAEMVHLDVTAADINPANPKVPTAAEIKTYVDTLTDETTPGEVLPFDNIALISYKELAADDEAVARFIKIKDEFKIIYRVDAMPKAVADITELEAIPKPEDGAEIQILADLPTVIKYVFNATATTGNPAADGTVGFWNILGNREAIRTVNHLTSGAVITATSEDGANTADKCLDKDRTTGWASTGEASPELTIVASNAFKPVGYTLARSSLQAGFKDANVGEPTKWEFQASVDGTTWVTLDAREGDAAEVVKDGGPVYFQLDDAPLEYQNYKLVFDLGDAAKQVQVTELQIVHESSNDAIHITTINAADL